MRYRRRTDLWRPLACAAGLILLAGAGDPDAAAERQRIDSILNEMRGDGRALFVREWVPGEPGPAGGDGLGPLYNATSCVACHHQGGPGGGGDQRHNVLLLTTFAGRPKVEEGPALFRDELERLHPGLRNQSSAVIHASCTAPDYEAWRIRLLRVEVVQTRDDLIAVGRSLRNTPALFGAGLISQVPDQALLEAAERRPAAFPEIKGRVSRLRDGQLGRFGWKGQTARLRDFVMAACSNELGLEVPGHHQASRDLDDDPAAYRLDLDAAQCNSLTAFVADLPAPPPPRTSTTAWGRRIFDEIGCSGCHRPDLAHVLGLYSDLLLHDLGDRTADVASGYGGGMVKSGLIADRGGDGAVPTSGEAGPTEWRTPPLWGVADSAPYLHDGRASDLVEAIRLHGGEAAKTTDRFDRLDRPDRDALLRFLRALRAPGVTPTARAARPPAGSNGG